MKGVIIIGYQGVGKSSCAGKGNCIDLESGNFWIGDHRADDWYIPYCNIAMDLANQGYTVFTSSHKVVYEYFANMPLKENVAKVVIFCPRRVWMKEWIERLEERYNKTGLQKDYKALENAKDRYEENLTELMNSGLPVYQPETIDYDFRNYVGRIRYYWCRE